MKQLPNDAHPSYRVGGGEGSSRGPLTYAKHQCPPVTAGAVRASWGPME